MRSTRNTVSKQIGGMMAQGKKEEAEIAKKEGADYLGVGAIYPTTTKVKTVITAVSTLKDIREAVSIPVVAIGGLTKDNIGVLSGSEGGPEAQALHSDPAQAEAYAKASGCDCLAVSIGNAHGRYKGRPKLNFGILEDIRRRLPDMPLVLHGGSGIPQEDLARAVKLGICKVNIATASFDALRQGALAQADGDYFALSEAMVRAVYESTLRQLKWFDFN